MEMKGLVVANDGSFKEDQEWQLFQLVFTSASRTANKIILQQGRVAPTILFLRINSGSVTHVGTLDIYEIDGAENKHIEIMEKVVDLDAVDVAVYLRETQADGMGVVNIRMVSKAFEMVVISPHDPILMMIVPGVISREMMIPRSSHKKH